jgi:hypothetical protein
MQILRPTSSEHSRSTFNAPIPNIRTEKTDDQNPCNINFRNRPNTSSQISSVQRALTAHVPPQPAEIPDFLPASLNTLCALGHGNSDPTAFCTR